jgi:hypothetical protein
MDKQIPGFEQFTISHNGEIRGVNGKILKKFIHTKGSLCGYATIGFWIRGENKTRHQKVHRLVAMTWVPNPDNKPEVNHKDGNKLNNHFQNLEWVTRSENIQHAFRTGLNKAPSGVDAWQAKFDRSQVIAIRDALRCGHKVMAIAKYFNVHYGIIYRLKSGKTYGSV